MRGRSIFALIAAAIAVAVACTPKEDIPAVETRISTATTSLDRKGGSMFVSVQASGDWTLEILFKDGSKHAVQFALGKQYLDSLKWSSFDQNGKLTSSIVIE